MLWSRSFYLTIINDLNRIIDRIEAGKPIHIDQTLNDLFSDPVEVRCPRLTSPFKFETFNHFLISVMNLTESSKFELVYQLFNGRQKSIIGNWEQVRADGSYFWRIAPTLNARCKCLV